jgi:hypothetical protein
MSRQFKWWLADTALKLKMLWFYRGMWRDWYSDVWKQDPDAQMCCNGHMCGCMGSCYGDMWEHYWNTRK